MAAVIDSNGNGSPLAGTDFTDTVRDAMAEVTRRFARPTDVDATLSAVTTAAVALLDTVDSADVLLIDPDDNYRSTAATSPLAEALSKVQQRYHQGPCVDAAVGETMVLSQNLREDARWPDFTTEAVMAGAHGVLSFQLYTHQKRPSCRAALNLFSTTASAFDGDTQTLAATLATHAALALIAQDREAQFQSALASRDAIGQAKGMLMERFGVDAVRAFELMRHLSQESNTPIVTIAARIITTGPDH
ncbi:GAF and ANTAR domain-containing protein [Mycolicibacterium tokaiense]|jgi:hypothetical protein|uniref:F420-dependent glucose-6-phosphate dehydrogenase n=1 Tax=Mycolicibacterium tokaiense TaxID=39695 RepID=A0A378TG27_9MYCO|nr:GAF and ANTAR domain-containing protein [Mycolicibacterium tokaiense]BBY85715.1 hypothetical protein MTOK_14970 [Mycolicibacterium tokaiense]STZ59772.1 F420-dependent glucose-6-phosphate dehydrogenase [Mycolicibacterium tokaiense]